VRHLASETDLIGGSGLSIGLVMTHPVCLMRRKLFALQPKIC
jgi:hypothetical protein